MPERKNPPSEANSEGGLNLEPGLLLLGRLLRLGDRLRQERPHVVLAGGLADHLSIGDEDQARRRRDRAILLRDRAVLPQDQLEEREVAVHLGDAAVLQGLEERLRLLLVLLVGERKEDILRG